MAGEARILSSKVCSTLETGYQFFEDTYEIKDLTFDNYRPMVFDESFEALKDSIKAHGVRVPVQAVYNNVKKAIIIISGERRARAVEQLRNEGHEPLPKLPVLLFSGQTSPEQELDSLVTSVVSNLMAKELSQVEKMRCYKMLQDKGMTKKEIARCCGKDRKTVERSLFLSEFDENTLSFIEANENEGLLKARHVEIVGQKLKKSLDGAEKEEIDANGLPKEKNNSEGQERRFIPAEKEAEIRDAAFNVLEEEVRRRQELKRPKTPEEKHLAKELRESMRKVNVDHLKTALFEEFDEGVVTRVIEILDQVANIHRDLTPTQVVTSDFATMTDTTIQ